MDSSPDSQPLTITAPLTGDACPEVTVGAALLVEGSVITLREEGYLLVAEALNGSTHLPCEIGGQLLYLPGPTPPAAPHTVGRSWEELGLPLQQLFELGLRGVIGEGFQDTVVQNLLNEHHGLVLSVLPENAAQAARSVYQMDLLPLGTGPTPCECLYRYHVKGFPVHVTHGPAC